MELDVLNFLIIKVRKIEIYEKYPITDRQFINCGKILKKICLDTKRKFLETSDERYKYHLINIKKFLRFRVSRLEYEFCKNVVNEYKAGYGNIIKEEHWNSGDLMEIKRTIVFGDAKTVEEAVNILERKTYDDK